MGMMNVPEMRRLRQGPAIRLLDRRRGDPRHAGVRVLAGVMIGIALSLLWLIAVATSPRSCSSGVRRGPRCSESSTSIPTMSRSRAWWSIRLDGGLFFATSDALEDRMRGLIHSTPDLSWLVLDCKGSTSSTPRVRQNWATSSARPKSRRSRCDWLGLKPLVRQTLPGTSFSNDWAQTRSTATSTAPWRRSFRPPLHPRTNDRPHSRCPRSTLVSGRSGCLSVNG